MRSCCITEGRELYSTRRNAAHGARELEEKPLPWTTVRDGEQDRFLGRRLGFSPDSLALHCGVV